MRYLDLLKEFFEIKFENQHGTKTTSGMVYRKRVSSLLLLLHDLKTLLVDTTHTPISPLGIATIGFSGIDLLASVSTKSKPKPGRVGVTFQCFLQKYWKLTSEESDFTWKFRNSVIHSYKPEPNMAIMIFDEGNTNLIVTHNGSTRLSLRVLYSKLVDSKKMLYEELQKEKIAQERQKLIDFLDPGAFVYTKI